MSTIKVTKTREVTDSQHDKAIVATGILKFITSIEHPLDGELYKDKLSSTIFYCHSNANNRDIGWPGNDIQRIRPIIVASKTEFTFEGEYYYDGINSIELYKGGHKPEIGYKILALPSHFTSKHLHAIKDGKIKVNSPLLVKCEDLFIGKENRKDINKSFKVVEEPLTLLKYDKSYPELYKDGIRKLGTFSDQELLEFLKD